MTGPTAERSFRFTLPESGPASLGIYNLRGQLVRELCSSNLKDGEHSYVWDGRDLQDRRITSGVYTVLISGGDGFEKPDTRVVKIAVIR